MSWTDFLVAYAVGALLGVIIEREVLRVDSPGPAIENREDVLRFMVSALLWPALVAMWSIWRDEWRKGKQ